jgi:hypothetical protein
MCSTDPGAISVSMSVGALAIDQWDTAVPFEVLLNRVDGALYRVKSAGRNCVVCEDPDSEGRSWDLMPGGTKPGNFPHA